MVGSVAQTRQHPIVASLSHRWRSTLAHHRRAISNCLCLKRMLFLPPAATLIQEKLMSVFFRGLLDFLREMARPGLGLLIVLLLSTGYVWYPGYESSTTIAAAILTFIFAIWDCYTQPSIGKAIGRLVSGMLFIWGSAIFYFIRIAGSALGEKPTWDILIELRSVASNIGIITYGTGALIGVYFLISKLERQRNTTTRTATPTP